MEMRKGKVKLRKGVVILLLLIVCGLQQLYILNPLKQPPIQTRQFKTV